MIPRGVAAALDSLRFSEAHPLSGLADSDWRQALSYCDRMQLSLLLHGDFPEWAREQIARDREKNRERVRRLKTAFREISAALAGIEFVVLKGFSHWGEFVADPEARVQYDLDLYCPHDAAAARDALMRLGYEPVPSPERFPTDHLPPLVRKTGWQWAGDFYDPEIPIAVELHFRLWDEATEGFAALGVETFWERRVEREMDGVRYLALAPADGLAYAALHLLRHLLRGDLRVAHGYEIACFLEHHSADHAFWSEWRELHGAELRKLQAIVFRLAAEWFGCGLHAAARREIACLPREIGRWFERCAWSPLAAFFRPNKDELALHLCLLDGFRAKARVLRRRLLPGPPGPLDAVFAREMTFPQRLRKRAQWSAYAFQRGVFHARALAPAVSTMLRMRR